MSNFTSRARRATVPVAKMRSHDILRFVLLNGLAVGLGAVVASSCIEVNYPDIAFRCNPKQSQNCPESHFCCSDDPAAADGRLPAYRGQTGSTFGTPLFSKQTNNLSTTGMCVNLDAVPCDLSLAEVDAFGNCGFPTCPIPCNPTWNTDQLERVCGTGRVCCQTVQLEPDDCVFDGNRWRPATGRDVGSPGIDPPTQWRPGDHSTHQDPGGRSCSQLANGATTLSDPVFRMCVNQLTVANQRGFCMPSCPAPPGLTPDACEIRNSMGPG